MANQQPSFEKKKVQRSSRKRVELQAIGRRSGTPLTGKAEGEDMTYSYMKV